MTAPSPEPWKVALAEAIIKEPTCRFDDSHVLALISKHHDPSCPGPTPTRTDRPDPPRETAGGAMTDQPWCGVCGKLIWAGEEIVGRVHMKCVRRAALSMEGEAPAPTPSPAPACAECGEPWEAPQHDSAVTGKHAYRRQGAGSPPSPSPSVCSVIGCGKPNAILPTCSAPYGLLFCAEHATLKGPPPWGEKPDVIAKHLCEELRGRHKQPGPCDCCHRIERTLRDLLDAALTGELSSLRGERVRALGRLRESFERSCPLCPDHRDKQQGRGCLACRIETLEQENSAL